MTFTAATPGCTGRLCNPADELAKAVAAKRESNPSLNFSRAKTMALNESPQLARAYVGGYTRGTYSQPSPVADQPVDQQLASLVRQTMTGHGLSHREALESVKDSHPSLWGQYQRSRIA